MTLSPAKLIAMSVVLIVLTLIGTYLLGGFEQLTAGGAAALIVGVTLSFALGIGLMAAVFHSSRAMDDEAHTAAKDQFKDTRPDTKS